MQNLIQKNLSQDGLTLNLDSMNMRDVDIEMLAPELLTLQVMTLSLKGNVIGNRGVEALAQVLPHLNVTTLNLGCNFKIGDEGAQALAEALPNSQLTMLELSRASIGDKGAKALAQALSCSYLTELNLNINNIGDEGAQDLAEALPDSQLSKLFLERNRIGAEGLKALAENLPKSKVTKLGLYNDYLRQGHLVNEIDQVKDIVRCNRPKKVKSKRALDIPKDQDQHQAFDLVQSGSKILLNYAYDLMLAMTDRLKIECYNLVSNSEKNNVDARVDSESSRVRRRGSSPRSRRDV